MTLPQFVDMTGQRFDRWLVLRRAQSSGVTMWMCRCDCGAEKSVQRAHLVDGRSRSCGCYRNEAVSTMKRKHGHCGKDHTFRTSTYEVWHGMTKRCRNSKSKAWRIYGGRGITVCERWRSFENFLADMGERPAGMTLDRRDNDGNYEPANCRWATQAEQCQNKQTSKLTAALALEVAGRFEHGESRRSIATRLGVKRHVVSDVLLGRSWVNVVGGFQ